MHTAVEAIASNGDQASYRLDGLYDAHRWYLVRHIDAVIQVPDHLGTDHPRWPMREAAGIR